MMEWNNWEKPCLMIWEAAPEQEIVVRDPVTIEIKRGNEVVLSIPINLHISITGIGIR